MEHHYRYYQKLRRVKKSAALAVGTAIHSTIEFHHEGKDWHSVIADFKREYDRLFAEERVLLGDLPADVHRIMASYFKKYENDGMTYPIRRRGIRTEIPVIVDLDSQTRFIGYIDAYPQDQKGRNWLMDHKSCKRVPDEDFRFSDLQLLIYFWLLPQVGYPRPDGVIWDYIRTKAPAIPEKLKSGEYSKAAKQDTDYETYMSTIIADLGPEKARSYEGFAETLRAKEERFFRRIYLPNPNPTMVGNVVDDLMVSIREIRERGPESKVRNMTWNCKSCSYYGLCQAEVRGLDADYIRKTEFIKKGEEDGNAEEGESESEE